MRTDIQASRSTRYRGFTLVELLVVIAIIGVLVALLLPAVQAAREAARRNQCLNNIKQTSLAVLNYESARKTLPIGAYGCCWGTWVMEVLPYIEQANMASQYTSKYRWDDNGNNEYRYYGSRNTPVTSQHITSMKCPSDGFIGAAESGNFRVTSHNYVVNYGNTGMVGSSHTLENAPVQVYGVRTNGAPNAFAGAPFYISGWKTEFPPIFVQLREITDGLSNTLMVSEIIQGRGTDQRGNTFWGWGAGFLTKLPPNASQPDVMQFPTYCDADEVSNPPCVDPHSNSRPMTNAARSWHPGGIHASFCDGSATYISDDIELDLWRGLSTTQGEELVGRP